MTDRAPIDGEELLRRIPGRWAGPTQRIARVLGAAGHRAWIVGGGVRDLILGRELKDIDLVSKARPEEVEGLFPKTVAVGKAFGIVVVVEDGLEIEVATFREERGYSDHRRPDTVIYTEDLAVDARRRDFTCNALFLDPLSGELADPTGGVDDLAASLLDTVGDPVDRFREDGLRLLRMARFLAALALEPAEGLLDAARACRGSLEGVSPERVLDELRKALTGPNASRAIETMEACGLAAMCLPGWGPEELDRGEGRRRIEVLRRLDDEEGERPKLAALFGGQAENSVRALELLRAPKSLRQETESVDAFARQTARAATLLGSEGAPSDPEERGRLIALRRDARADEGLLLAGARADVDGETAQFDRYVALLDSLASGAPEAPATLTSSELMELGVPRGPLLGRALERVLHAGLGGAFCDADGARAWAVARLGP